MNIMFSSYRFLVMGLDMCTAKLCFIIILFLSNFGFNFFNCDMAMFKFGYTSVYPCALHVSVHVLNLMGLSNPPHASSSLSLWAD